MYFPTRSGLGGRDQNPLGGEVGARKTHCTPRPPPKHLSVVRGWGSGRWKRGGWDACSDSLLYRLLPFGD